jgi:hypothetical protein
VVVVLWLCDCIELGCEVFEAAPAASGEAGVLAAGEAPIPLFEAAAPGLLDAPLLLQLEEIMLTLFTWMLSLPLEVPLTETVCPTCGVSCEASLACRFQVLPLLS